ncbi:CHAD domain-containing protein [Ktedonosporobacter rubrisoli]|uniref:CHAD domain-containing protein n=1 Tax=Ktedonosporobacter rubrisoli TaxID=2509675 RepID=A0A4P6JUE4_KTERU|nr:CHAD domain-containing protein [Ktedonosporobacter rubrisoli]QBD78912.1 CHAD domain-containing protein [Ktedonosporobacter rubrisoli]
MAKAKPIAGLVADASVGTNARIVCRARLEEVYAWDQYVDDPYRKRELHDLRIAIKRLRYTLEIFAEALPASCQEALSELEKLQEELGTLHDSDVMIALLRLCLGSQDSGTGYEVTLSKAGQIHAEGKFLIKPELVAHVVDPKVAPSVEERQGLETLLKNVLGRREEQYTVFYRHWSSLREQNFRHTLLDVLGA